MKNRMKNLTITLVLVAGIFGITEAQVTEVTGEFSTDITSGETTSYSSPYTGLVLLGDGWELSTNLSDGNVNVEEAKYSWSLTEALTLTFGSQAEPYGLAWGLHRPATNSFVSSPREHSVVNGLGVDVTKWGVGVNFLHGGGEEDYWATRVSYDLSLLGINSTVGLSVNSNDAQLLDVSTGGSALGIPFESSLEYDLADDGAYWLRGVVTPSFAKGAFGLIGYNSDEEVLYGVGYKCSDKVKLATELSDDNDTLIRVSYSF